MYYASLSGTPIQHGTITIPFSGLWHADVVLTETIDPHGPQTLVLGPLSMSCAIIRAINWVGSRGVRIVGGAGGWRLPLPSKFYQSASNVQLSIVLNDAAREAGEKITVSNDIAIGTAYVRSTAPASNVLNDLIGAAWWIDPSGTVQNKPQSTDAIISDFVATQVHGASGLVTVATEAPQDWTPGRTFSGPTISGTISRVQHKIAPGSIRTEVMLGQAA